MSRFQVTAVGICVLLNALDGFDVLSISFAAPGIAEEWSIDRARLGIVLSMELIGMGLGSLIFGNVADRYGRRRTILGCLVGMTAGMGLAATADSTLSLSAYRVVTGLGIGGMLAATNAMVAEYSNAKWRSTCVAVMAAGYPLGAVIGGTIASALLATFDWRSVFVFGFIATGMFLPLVWFLLPESIEYLAEKRPPNALKRINATLRRMGHAAIAALPERTEAPSESSLGRLFSPALVRTTLLLTMGYLAHIMTFYFLLKWIPKLVVDMGFEASQAGGVLVWSSLGGLAGSALLGVLTRRFGVRPLVIGSLIGACLTVAWFGQTPPDLTQLSIIAAAAGVFTNAAIVGMYAIFAQSFPTEVRAGGTGFVIGVSRGGAVLGPIVAGFLLAAGSGMGMVALLMAGGSLIGALAITLLRFREPSGHTTLRTH